MPKRYINFIAVEVNVLLEQQDYINFVDVALGKGIASVEGGYSAAGQAVAKQLVSEGELAVRWLRVSARYC